MIIEDDVKIYGQDIPSYVPPSEGEKSADLYLHHKQNGNLDKCKEMGVRLANTFLEHAIKLTTSDFYAQKMVLLFFVLDNQLQECFHDSILLKSTQSRIRKIIERENSDLSKVITDNTAFTLYILDDRSGCDDCLGETFAQLCDQDDDQALQSMALSLIEEYSSIYRGMIKEFTFT